MEWTVSFLGAENFREVDEPLYTALLECREELKPSADCHPDIKDWFDFVHNQVSEVRNSGNVDAARCWWFLLFTLDGDGPSRLRAHVASSGREGRGGDQFVEEVKTLFDNLFAGEYNQDTYPLSSLSQDILRKYWDAKRARTTNVSDGVNPPATIARPDAPPPQGSMHTNTVL